MLTFNGKVSMTKHERRNSKRIRRFSVSSESNSVDDDTYKKKVYPKDSTQLTRIQDSLEGSFLFTELSLDQGQRQEVYDAMFEKRVKAGQIIYSQGDKGDYFYVIETGTFEVWKKIDATTPSRKMFEYQDDGSFGELALMYNCPRPATVKATSAGLIWCLDRQTFRHILVESRARKRQQTELFLRRVPIFSSLTDNHRSKIADILESEEHMCGDPVFETGDTGEHFYLVAEGVAVATQEFAGEEREVGRISTGGYFGELALLYNQPRAATIRALSDELVVQRLDSENFSRLLSSVHPALRSNAAKYKKADINNPVYEPPDDDFKDDSDGFDDEY